MRKLQTPALLSIAVVALLALIGLRARQAVRAKRAEECRSLTKALDKTIREKTPRVFEGILGHRWNPDSKRCLASLEYHYKPCDAALAEKTPQYCAGPDADIAVYAFEGGGARPLLMCERHYASGEAGCTEPVYGDDGILISSREIPPDQFPALKAGMFPEADAP